MKEVKETFKPTEFPEEEAKALFKTKEELKKEKDVIIREHGGVEVLD